MTDKFMKRFAGFRLNPADEFDQIISKRLLEEQEAGKNIGDYVKGCIVFNSKGQTILFDDKDPIHTAVKAALEDIPEKKRQQWLVEMVFERLTGTDSKTGKPLAKQVQIIEVEKPIITEVVKVVTVDGNHIVNTEEETAPTDTDEQGYSGVDSIGW